METRFGHSIGREREPYKKNYYHSYQYREWVKIYLGQYKLTPAAILLV